MRIRIESVLLYYITDRLALGTSEQERWECLLAKIAEAARAGVDYIQLREKDLSIRELEKLARAAVTTVRQNGSSKLLINSRADVAIAAGADGVHLPASDLPASEVRAVLMSGGMKHPIVAVSCHSQSELRAAEGHGADFAVFGPVFGKAAGTGVGLSAISAYAHGARAVGNTEAAYGGRMPVLALGGVTIANAHECVKAGAAGVAGIRLFQDVDDLAGVVNALRNPASKAQSR